MSDPTETDGPALLPTDIGPVPTKLPIGARPVLKQIDLTDEDQVFDLAVELQSADRRRLMRVTLAQWQVIARRCARAAIIESHAREIARRIDQGAPQADIAAATDALLQIVRTT